MRELLFSTNFFKFFTQRLSKGQSRRHCERSEAIHAMLYESVNWG